MNSVIVYGARGALGSELVKKFSCGLKWKVFAIDLNLESSTTNDDAKFENNVCQILIEKSNSLIVQASQVENKLNGIVNAMSSDKLKVNAIICAAGGWAGGNASSKDFVANSEAMLQQSVWPSVICSRLAALHLDTDGLLVVLGAKAALSATPSMIGYGLAKAATVQLVRSLAQPVESGLPSGACTLGVLPETLDTPNNRKWMPNAEHSKWTSLEYLSSLFGEWASSGERRPKSGSLIVLSAQSYSISEQR